MCAVMIAMSGLAQNLEQFIYFICDCCLLGFLPLSQNKSLFRQGENETLGCRARKSAFPCLAITPEVRFAWSWKLKTSHNQVESRAHGGVLGC